MSKLSVHTSYSGEGVGKSKQGLVEHIKVVKKETETGVRAFFRSDATHPS